MATPLLLRLLPLLLLLLPPPLREYLKHGAKDDAATGVLHPIVLFPGASCPYVEARLTEAYRPSVPRCGAMIGKPWFGLWENASDIPAHHYIQCFKEQMSLVYDPAVNNYRNPAGVLTRIPNFGSPSGFGSRNPHQRERCLAVLRDSLESMGYHDGDTLFGAPYDLHYAPPSPGQTSQVYSVYFEQVTRLVEDASSRNGGKKAILFGHSFGGLAALEFVRSRPPAWRSKYVKHLILVAPTIPALGFVDALRKLIEGADSVYVPGTTALSLRAMWRTFETAMVNVPSRSVFGHDPLVTTRHRNYSAYDMEDLLAAIGFADGVEPYRRRQLPRTRGDLQAPLVPVTCVNGVGRSTPRRLVYWEGDFDAAAELVYGDGDGSINLATMLAFDDKMRQHPVQRKQFKSIKLAGAGHSDIVKKNATGGEQPQPFFIKRKVTAFRPRKTPRTLASPARGFLLCSTQGLNPGCKAPQPEVLPLSYKLICGTATLLRLNGRYRGSCKKYSKPIEFPPKL